MSTMSDETRARLHDAQLQAGNAYGKRMDALLEQQPPEVVWVKNKRGVMVAAEVHDPHTLTPNRRKHRDHPDCTCLDAPAKQPRDTPLLSAARNEL